MIAALIIGSIIIVICIAASNFLHRFGMPALIMFMLLGLVLGHYGPWGDLSFTDYHIAETICSIALAFIIFYGGFGTNWKTARPVVVESVIFAIVGSLLTTAVVTLFAHFVFSLGWAESFLIGAVISNTDAASVFSILRTKKLSLKYNTASVLEIESGVNDMPSYILTIIAIIILQGQSIDSIPLVIVLQLVDGLVVGVVIAVASMWILKKVGAHLLEGMGLIFVLCVAMLSFALATELGGNGYLACYLCGIILGNAKIPKRAHMVNFFESIDWLAQILIFFLMGLMVVPTDLPAAIIPGILLSLFLLVIARPLSVFTVFPFFKHNGRRNPLSKGLFISWSGIRGAASIVFVLIALASGVMLQSDLFSVIFIVTLFSIAVQGTLMPGVAQRLNMIDEESDYKLSFNDYQEQSSRSFFKINISESHPWAHQPIKNISLGPSILIVIIKRKRRTLTPRGDTIVLPGDIVVLSGEAFDGDADTQITTVTIERNDPWANKLIRDLALPDDTLIVSITREDGTAVTPKGDTRVNTGDTITYFTLDYEREGAD